MNHKLVDTNVSQFGLNNKKCNKLEGVSYEAYKTKVKTIFRSKGLKEIVIISMNPTQ
jgi:hypothetical protein